MIDERALIARVEAADPNELAQVLTRPNKDEERALRAHFGDERYQRLHHVALKRSIGRGARAPKGNVVVIHGIMGSELTAFDRQSVGERVWVNIPRLILGWLDRLQLNDDGRTESNSDYNVCPTGIMKSYYGELLLALSSHWDVRGFWFDWRKDLKLAAAALQAQLSNWFADSAPVHIVAHSMGGLVARTFIKYYEPRWRTMWDKSSQGRQGGRLVMLGTPNYGSYIIPQIFAGLEPLVRKLAQCDLRHDLNQVLEIISSFIGCYQMLPSPLVAKSEAVKALYQAGTYPGLNIPQRHLDYAAQFHEDLDKMPVDGERIIYVAGYNRPTPSGIRDLKRLDSIHGYEMTLMGDGRVTHELGILKANGTKIPTYYIEEDHGELTTNELVMDAVDGLLETGETTVLSQHEPSTRAVETEANQRALREKLARRYQDEEKRIQELTRSLERNRAVSKSNTIILSEEQELREELTRGFLSGRGDGPRRADELKGQARMERLEIGLVYGEIQDIDELSIEGSPVDAIAVGHYLGVKPVAAERALDQAISRSLRGKLTRDDGKLLETDLLITQYAERGTIRGELGQPFFISDPRPRKGRTTAAERLIAIAGMGVPGYFGVPELKVLARELSGALGRLGKRHLATVVIGAGNGNIPIREAIGGWISGVRQSITGAKEDKWRRLQRLTFVERDPRRIVEIEQAILNEQARLKQERRLDIRYTKVGQTVLNHLQRDVMKNVEAGWQKELERIKTGDHSQPTDMIPTRVSIFLDGKSYHFAAITESASIPERPIPLDPKLVEEANDQLVAERDVSMQLERGQLLEHLLVPDDLRQELYTDAPLVLMLDSTTARIHWEMIAQSDPLSLVDSQVSQPGDAARRQRAPNGEFAYRDKYLGTCRGLTRQLRLTFAPPPEPPPPPKRLMRVLVVADPAEDAPLPGAEAEGAEVADLFESFNAVYRSPDNRVEVVRLFGPREATRTNVLRELILRRYDVLHFAGHCVYERDNLASSGWIFTGGERLSANELNRVDRVPKFVFSNACESGITPDRSENRSVDLAPSFAEAFFARGVSNFVCTAWPVDDIAARLFALRLYSGLLGLKKKDDGGDGYVQGILEPMHVAMREARCLIAGSQNGARTWGAYQHYGNPYFRFFDPYSLTSSVQSRTRR
ncbi:MAG: CHAT domain-containing protein [Acidobacteria bacterium]|nr:CHAT domain-containing protein [Acidobacteriota bacterium]